jgi:peptidoglycan/LPS O-acetylase OafA/YrhL
MANQKIQFANGLRGIASLSVIIGHYLGAFWALPEAVKELTGMTQAAVNSPAVAGLVNLSPVNFGAFGVALFFIISGFVIPFSFQSYGRLDFFVGRFFRIYPTYWIGLTASLTVLAIGGYALDAPFPHSHSQLLYGYLIGARDVVWVKSVDGVVWTIEIELKFYMICGLIAPWLREGSLKVFLVPVALLAISCILGATLPTAQTTTFFFVALSAPYLIFMFIGVAFNYLHRGKITFWAAVAAAPATLLMYWMAHQFGFSFGNPFVLTYVVAVAVFTLTMRFSAIVGAIPTINFWADISYPLYVVHGLTGYVLIEVMITFGFGAWPAVVLAFVAVVALATTLHMLIETPSREMGRKIAASMRNLPSFGESPS